MWSRNISKSNWSIIYMHQIWSQTLLFAVPKGHTNNQIFFLKSTWNQYWSFVSTLELCYRLRIWFNCNILYITPPLKQHSTTCSGLFYQPLNFNLCHIMFWLEMCLNKNGWVVFVMLTWRKLSNEIWALKNEMNGNRCRNELSFFSWEYCTQYCT